MSQPTPQEQVKAKTDALVERITQAAVARARLEQVRSYRDAAPEHVADAAAGFRKAEADMHVSLNELLDLQVRLLHEAAGTSVEGR